MNDMKISFNVIINHVYFQLIQLKASVRSKLKVANSIFAQNDT